MTVKTASAMSALNELLRFDQLPESDQQAFGGHVMKKCFPKDYLFYKMSRKTDHGQFAITPWWSSYEPVMHGDSGFVGSWNHPLGIRTYTRINAAVPEQWNSLDNLMMMRLRTTVFGFAGKCERQLAHTGKNPLTTDKFGSVYLGGGHVQVMLPNLRIEHIEWMMSCPV